MRTIKMLSKAQRSKLGIMAKEAWKKHHDSGATEEKETEWRHREARAVCNYTISEAPERCYDALHGHFLMLQGHAGRAFDHHMGPGNEERRQRHKIGELAKELGLPEGYAGGKPARQLKGIIINLEARSRAARALRSVRDA